MPNPHAALVHPINGEQLLDIEKRQSSRQPCRLEATSRLLETADGMAWGGTVTDVSAGGFKLGLCFPFRRGTYLAVDLEARTGTSLVCRVVHVHDHADGTWTLGCEFLKQLSESEVDQLM